jgi:serum/glucocorticoid-regulated kinase 2
LIVTLLFVFVVFVVYLFFTVVFQGQTHSMPVDWWSLGTLAYEMLTGLPPYYSQNINEMYEKILYDPLTFPAFLSEECKSFLEGLLTRDPEKRLG